MNLKEKAVNYEDNKNLKEIDTHCLIEWRSIISECNKVLFQIKEKKYFSADRKKELFAYNKFYLQKSPNQYEQSVEIFIGLYKQLHRLYKSEILFIMNCLPLVEQSNV